ncbi:MAG: sensor histidine kinase [Ktedonobacterales bacterium]
MDGAHISTSDEQGNASTQYEWRGNDPLTALKAWFQAMLVYPRAVLTEPFLTDPDEILLGNIVEHTQHRRAALLRLLLLGFTSLQIVLSLVTAMLLVDIGDIPQAIIFSVVPLMLLTAFCALLNSLQRTGAAAIIYVTGSLTLNLLWLHVMPGGLDAIVLLRYALLSIVIVVAGLTLPQWLHWLTSAVVALASVVSMSLTPLSSQLAIDNGGASGAGGAASWFELSGEESVRLSLAIGLISLYIMIAALSAIAARSAQADVEAAFLAYDRERELVALKDQFLIDANHELRTPIMALYGNVEMLLALHEHVTIQERGEMLTRALQAGDTVRRVLSSVLDVTMLDMSTPQVHVVPVALAPLIQTVLETFDPRELGSINTTSALASRPVALDIPTDAVVLADEVRLRQIIINLLTNALKYSPPGSRLNISATAIHPKRQIGFLARSARGDGGPQRKQEAPQYQINVQDYGLGVPPRDVYTIFNRFVRLERDIAGPMRGTGVGLYLCKVLVEAMGGRIWVRSTGVPGEGSTFSFILPGASEDELSQFQEARQAPVLQAANRNG